MNVDYDEIKYSGEDPVYDDTKDIDPKVTTKRKVIKGKRKKKSMINRLVYVFTGSSNMRELMEDVIEDTVKPAFRDMVAETMHGMTDSFVYGERGSYQRPYRNYAGESTRRATVGRRDYTAPSREPARESRRYSKKALIEPVSFDYNSQAMDVLKELNDEIRNSGRVSVAEFYKITGEENIQFSDNYYGWTSVTDCQVRRTKDGWTLFMSDPIDITDY